MLSLKFSTSISIFIGFVEGASFGCFFTILDFHNHNEKIKK